MKISSYRQVPFKLVCEQTVDLLICSSGYEDRSTYLASKLDATKIKEKVAIEFNDNGDAFSRKRNDQFFATNGFSTIRSDGDFENEIIHFLEKFMSRVERPEVRIVVDYSSMTRIWYSGILRFFRDASFEVAVSISFCYSIAKFVSAPEPRSYNIHIGPIKGFSGFSVPQMPTALIIGLGYEKNRAIGLTEYLDAETFLFITDGSKVREYSEEVLQKNIVLMSKIKNENIFFYPINQLELTAALLISLYENLSVRYRIVVAPCGPKPFTFLSLFTSLLKGDIDVWRISSGKESIPVNKTAEGEIVVFDVVFGSL